MSVRATASAQITPYDRLVWPEAWVERWLEAGEHRRELVAYFGAELYEELTRLAQRPRAPPRPREQVWILPGMMNSQLGVPRAAGEPPDLLWLDPLDVIQGRLAQLADVDSGRIRPLGVMLATYLPLKLVLRAAGYDVRCFAYDWRLDLTVEARRLVTTLRGEIARSPDLRLRLVAHSLGGLVVRAALAEDPALPVELTLFLGTPHAGAWGALQALRGTYPVIRKLASLDHVNTAGTLAASTFSRFTSLQQLLPDAAAALLDRSPVRPRLAPLDARAVSIVGNAAPTVVAASREAHGGLLYTYRIAGDGTVPLESAAPPGSRAFCVPVGHSDLPRSALVQEACSELLQSSRCALPLLEATAPASRAALAIGDDELAAAHSERVDWAALGPDERRVFLETLNEPPARVRAHFA